MPYEHVAMIPFMIEASQLTAEEAAERAANPARWAARRYGMPEHIFQAAGQFRLIQMKRRQLIVRKLNDMEATEPDENTQCT